MNYNEYMQIKNGLNDTENIIIRKLKSLIHYIKLDWGLYNNRRNSYSKSTLWMTFYIKTSLLIGIFLNLISSISSLWGFIELQGTPFSSMCVLYLIYAAIKIILAYISIKIRYRAKLLQPMYSYIVALYVADFVLLILTLIEAFLAEGVLADTTYYQSSAYVLGQLFATLIIAILNLIYFNKRRAFFNCGIKINSKPKAPTINTNNVNNTSPRPMSFEEAKKIALEQKVKEKNTNKNHNLKEAFLKRINDIKNEKKKRKVLTVAAIILGIILTLLITIIITYNIAYNKGFEDNQPISSDGSATVYITPSGRRYHKKNCLYLYGNEIPISTTQAKKKGYTACAECHSSTSTKSSSSSSSANNSSASSKKRKENLRRQLNEANK